jgi:hypothetical protein
MALARCDEHKPEPAGSDFVSYALPVGYPSTTVGCDAVACPNPARMWLTSEEKAAFEGGTRTFRTERGTAVQVSDDLFPD